MGYSKNPFLAMWFLQIESNGWKFRGLNWIDLIAGPHYRLKRDLARQK